MVGAHQNLNGSSDLTTPFSRHPWTSTCYDKPIYQIWSLYLYLHHEDTKSDTK